MKERSINLHRLGNRSTWKGVFTMTMEDKKLTMEEMEQVAGGTIHESSDDSKFLNVLLHGRPGRCDRYGTWRAGCNYTEIANAWASVGIKAVLNDHSLYKVISNEYYLNGKQISREEAWAHAEQVVGKHLEKKDWNW